MIRLSGQIWPGVAGSSCHHLPAKAQRHPTPGHQNSRQQLKKTFLSTWLDLVASRWNGHRQFYFYFQRPFWLLWLHLAGHGRILLICSYLVMYSQSFSRTWPDQLPAAMAAVMGIFLFFKDLIEVTLVIGQLG